MKTSALRITLSLETKRPNANFRDNISWIYLDWWRSRFILGQIGMGILYLFTVGLCFIGTIVDLVNYKQLTLEYNQQQAQEIILLMK